MGVFSPNVDDVYEFPIPIDSPIGELLGTGMELTPFSIDIDYPPANGQGSYVLSGGYIPESLTLSSSGLISGLLTEIDAYHIPYFIPPDLEIGEGGEHYAEFGSAKYGSAYINFIVDITYEDPSDGLVTVSVPYSIQVYNNWSSDRNRLIHDITNEFGFDDNGVMKYFEINGTPVSAEDFINYQMSQGFYPAP